jgi:hypothetical protein
MGRTRDMGARTAPRPRQRFGQFGGQREQLRFASEPGFQLDSDRQAVRSMEQRH